MGASAMAFEPIVAAGPRGALPHARPSSRTLAPGDLVVIDMGGVLDGYCSDLTRTVAIGDPDEVAAEMLRYNEVLGANHIIMSVQGVGMPQTQVLETFHLMAEEVFPKVRRALS